MPPKKKRPDVVEPMKMRCREHPYYKGDRKPEGCSECTRIWEAVCQAQETYFEEMRQRTLPPKP